ncbi:MAG: N-formylglutamate amidohydrolase [Myxococcales bacterium]
MDPESSFAGRMLVPPETPVVLSVPHAGIATTGFEGSLAETLEVRGDADLFVDRLYQVEEGATGPEGVSYLVARLSRFVCDMNRQPDDVSRAAVPEHPAPGNADGRGFVWAVTTTGAPALARALTLEEWQARAAVHAAYHAAIEQALLRARDRFGFAVLLDGHSMPSVGRSGHKDPGRPRAEVVPGDRDGTSCSPGLAALVTNHFTSSGYSVEFNTPYKGGFITAHHGRPSNDVHAIQIELRRDLYMNEAAFTPLDDGFHRLQASLQDLLRAIGRWKP